MAFLLDILSHKYIAARPKQALYFAGKRKKRQLRKANNFTVEYEIKVN